MRVGKASNVKLTLALVASLIYLGYFYGEFVSTVPHNWYIQTDFSLFSETSKRVVTYIFAQIEPLMIYGASL